ncbi:unnamed protein product [Cyprideis torosa]|uniref:Lipoate-protein ligase B n=1 Tax=Cyprideis torosa TaxID=163714 RepID=A0A7R8ZK59_9CRUS|nr:unnamed protein product [Cyprideis torosa]CAG0890067.1 unnamed protein product [Cyprideis torosa]
MKQRINFKDLGTEQDYVQTWEYQQALQQELIQLQETGQERKAYLLFLEHPHVYTLGKSGDANHLLVSKEQLEKMGATFVPTNRGGDITYHGPGQLVGYPIMDLHYFKQDIHWYMRQLEEVLIRTLAEYHIEGQRSEESDSIDENGPYGVINFEDIELDEDQMFYEIILDAIQHIGKENLPEKSPRYVGDFELPPLPASIRKIGVFQNQETDLILELVEEHHLDGVQLHGEETAESCSELKDRGLTILKAFSPQLHFDWDQLEDYFLVVDYFLFDTSIKGQSGGTGKKFDWDLLHNYDGNVPFLLSGGIGPKDAAAILSIDHPMLAGVDVNSGFEIKPGLKDLEKLSFFMEEIKT